MGEEEGRGREGTGMEGSVAHVQLESLDPTEKGRKGEGQAEKQGLWRPGIVFPL